MKFESGTKFLYSNVGYSLLGIIVEKVSGESYENFLYKNLRKPAGMDSTGYTRPDFNKDSIVVGYKEDEIWGKPNEKQWDKDAPFRHLKAKGGILSTSEDLYKWHVVLLSDKVLSKEAKQKYFSPKLRVEETDRGFYAYGWGVEKTERNTKRILHNGTNRIFYADFQRYVDEKIAIIMLLNKAEPSLNQASFAIADIFFKPSSKPTIPIVENKTNRKLTEEIIKAATEKGFDEAIKIYKTKDIKTELLERLVNEKSYDLLLDKQIDKAFDLFKLNVFVFKNFANAYDSLGEVYFLKKNYDEALANYKKSLELDAGNENAKEMILKIEEALKNKSNP